MKWPNNWWKKAYRLVYTLVIYINLAVVYVDGNTRQFKKIGHQKLKKGDLKLTKGW